MSNPTITEYIEHVIEEFTNEDGNLDIERFDESFPTMKDLYLQYYTDMDDENNVVRIMMGLDPLD